MVELLDELKGGQSTVTLVGKAVVRDNSLKGVQLKEGKTWKHVDSSIGVDTGEGNVIYARIWGGYKIDNPVLKRWNAENEFVDIKWEDRLKEDVVEGVRDFDLLKAGLEVGEDGKLIIKEFISEIDFEEYLREHLTDGMKVRVRGKAEYSEYNDNIQRRYSVQSVYLAQTYEKDGVEIAPEDMATLRQTYVLNADALERNWESKLAKEGETFITVFVPQYVSTVLSGGKYVPLKKTMPYPQSIIVRLDDKEDEAELKKKKTIIKKFFSVDKKTVREIVLINNINEGYEETTGVQLNDEMRELIDLGVFTEEDIKKQTTIRGNKVSKLTFIQPAIRRNDKGDIAVLLDDEKYSLQALVAPFVDGEDDAEDVFEDNGTVIADDEFNSLFG